MGRSRNKGRRSAAVEAVVETVDGGLAQLIPDPDRG
ncbi:spermine synthase, partial [Streptomyces diastatochromogenes]